jgi:hypothetical protein
MELYGVFPWMAFTIAALIAGDKFFTPTPFWNTLKLINLKNNSRKFLFYSLLIQLTT